MSIVAVVGVALTSVGCCGLLLPTGIDRSRGVDSGAGLYQVEAEEPVRSRRTEHEGASDKHRLRGFDLSDWPW